ncbi:hypothetical protein I2483_09725 [Sporosarcina sp. E16_3]|nr:hypothetical protein [Sporosarcina sp. E16_3]MBO0601940.1 hypothetical protein [Sporosarcina sp. E16_3]
MYHFTEQELLVNNLRENGKTFNAISEFIDVSRSRPRQIYVKYKQKEKYNSILEDFLKDESIEFISLKYKYPITTVESLIDTFNKKENYTSLIRSFKSGESMEFIARKNGYTVEKVRYLIKKFEKHMKKQY